MKKHTPPTQASPTRSGTTAREGRPRVGSQRAAKIHGLQKRAMAVTQRALVHARKLCPSHVLQRDLVAPATLCAPHGQGYPVVIITCVHYLGPPVPFSFPDSRDLLEVLRDFLGRERGGVPRGSSRTLGDPPWGLSLCGNSRWRAFTTRKTSPRFGGASSRTSSSRVASTSRKSDRASALSKSNGAHVRSEAASW